jgi:hypothetical protein
VHTTPTKALLTTILQPFVVQLSSSLAHEIRLRDQFLHDALTPQKMAEFEWALRALLREVGRRIRTWVLHHVKPANDAEAPSRGRFEGRPYRRRAKHQSSVVTLFGIVSGALARIDAHVLGAISAHTVGRS